MEVLALCINLGAILALLAYVGAGAARELLDRRGGSEGSPWVMLGLGLMSLAVQALNFAVLCQAQQGVRPPTSPPCAFPYTARGCAFAMHMG